MRKTVQKRIWAIVLTLCMMISLMPSALAASAKDFTDVPPKAWYYGAVDYVAEHGYFNGTDVGKFSPDKPMTRGMFVTVLARVDGVEGNDQANPFEDVPSGMWYSGAVAWAAERGIVLGVGDNRFAPERQVSRQEMAAFIARYLTYYMKEHGVTFQATGTAPAFKDADKIADYAVEAVELCRTYGLVYGDEKGCFVPGSLATRAEAATVIQRLALLLETGEEEPSGGGGGGGGGGTSASASSGTAAGFIQAAQKEADTVTATVETDNSITVNDDIAISNPSVKTLTLDLNNASLGNLTVNSTSATRIEIKGETASVSSLTINAPRATVTNGVAVNGSVNLQAVSNSTFNNTAPISGNITVTGPAAVNDTQENPAPVVIATEKQVIVRGKSETISIQADGAKLTLSTAAAVNPTVSSTAENVTLAVTTGEQTTISGTVEQVTATASAPKLKVEGTVAVLAAKAAASLSLTGGGLVENLAAGSTNIEIPLENTALSIASAELVGGSLTAPDGVVDTVKASGTVELKASVNKAETQPGTTLKLAGEGKTVNTLTAGGTLTMAGQGTVGQIDVTANTSSTVEIAQEITVSAVNNTGSGQVKLEDKGNAGRVATEKAAPPTTVRFAAPTAAGGKGTITGVTNAMEYRASGDWEPINSESISVDAGTYQVRVKATDTKLASEAVTVTIPAAVAVKEAAVQGKPYVGQTLTAVANADATGTLAYEWKAGETVIAGAQGKTFVLTDKQIGKAVTVTISNYEGSETATSAPTAAITADKTALKKLLDKAEEVQQGVVVEDLSAEKVAKGIVFVTAQEKADLTTAVGHAKEIADNKDALASAVSGQEKALRAAVDAYTAAKKVGTLDEAATLQSALVELINAATGAKVQTTAADAAEVEPGKAWVTEEVKSAYEAAISAAEAAKDSGDSAVLAKAITDLNAAMSVYQKAVRKGAALDDTALLAAVNAAELNAASVSISADGKDVLPSQSWVTELNKGTYTAAIAAAKNTSAATQSVNAKALTTLNAATEIFNGKKEQGTKDIIPPIVTDVSAEKQETGAQYTISFTSNEAGTYSYQAGSTEGAWTAGETFSEADTPVTFAYTPAAPGAVLYLQVSDASGNASVVQVKVGEDPETAEASIGSAKYETFEQALAAASSGQTIKLLKDVELSEAVTITKSVTLELNGQTINGTGFSARAFTVNAPGKTVTVLDSSSDRTGAINSENGSFKVDAGTLNIGAEGKFGGNYNNTVQNWGGIKATGENVTINVWDAKITSTTGGCFAIEGGAGDVLNIYGGTFTQQTYYDFVSCCVGFGSSATINISGGEFTCKDGQSVLSGWDSGATVNITGGVFTAEGKAKNVFQVDAVPGNIKTVDGGDDAPYQAPDWNISGGTFTGPIEVSATVNEIFPTSVEITGGTFSVDPSAYVAQDYKVVKNTEDTYTVGVKTEPDENDVASVGGRFFTTLQAAFDAAHDGETIQLCKDAVAEDGVEMERAGVTLNLDLARHTYTVTNGANVNNRAFKIISGTLNVTGGGKIVAVGSGTTAAEGSGAYGAFRVEAEGVLNVSGVTLENSRPYGLNVKVCGGEATLSGVTIHSSYGGGIEVTESKLGEKSKLGTATVADCTFTQKNYSDHCSSTLSVSGGSTLNVSGGTYTSESGRALYVFSSGGYINVSGGTFSGVKDVIRAEIDTNTYPEYEGGLKITGGDFTGPITITSPASLTITGGTFSVNPSAYVRDDLTAKESGGKWIIEKRTADDPGTVASVGERCFRTLASAVEAAQSGDTIKLLQDTKLTEIVTIPASAEITLDLNGKTLTLDASGTRLIQNEGNLTINGNSGKISGINSGAYGLIDNYGSLEANQVTFKDVGLDNGASIKNRPGVNSSLTLNQCSMTATGENKGNANVYSDGTLTINGGTFTDYSSGAYAVICNSGEATLRSDSESPLTVEGAKGALGINSGTVTINGGTYTSGTYYGVWITNNGVNTDVTINDGSFTGERYGLYASVDDGKQDSSNANILVQGGSFTGNTEAAAALNESQSKLEWCMTIVGGTFSTNPSDYVPEGYEATESNGSWTVAAVAP